MSVNVFACFSGWCLEFCQYREIEGFEELCLYFLRQHIYSVATNESYPLVFSFPSM